MKCVFTLVVCLLPILAFSQPTPEWISPSYLESNARYGWIKIRNNPIEYRFYKFVQGSVLQIMSTVYDTIPTTTISLLPSERFSADNYFDVSGDGYNDIIITRSYPPPSRYGFRVVNTITGQDLYAFDDSSFSYFPANLDSGLPPDIDNDGFNELIVDRVKKAASADQAYREYFVYQTKGIATSISERAPSKPNSFQLEQNFPNPFNPSTQIKYNLSLVSSVEVEIYDITGSLVRSFNFPHQEIGTHAVLWDGKDSNAKSVSSGPYFYRIIANGYSDAKKMLLLR